MTKGTGW